MAAPEKAQENEKKKVVRPAAAGPIPLNRQQNSEKNGITAIFVGLFESDSVTRALFINSNQNSGRLSGPRQEEDIFWRFLLS